ncbi:MAG: cytochrome b/b6 domain-containing protein [Bryobacterales bacterium]|nr:cytochrome b/b6 domain-containing protein [Bryobacterales bacterium]
MRVTHWITVLCFLALLVSGVNLVISHPRFYWGEEGNVNTPALFQLPIPASRAAVQTGYGYVLPDQNGWSRSLHFQAAWLVVFAGLTYALHGWRTGHFVRSPYVGLQRAAYAGVVFVLFPLMIWTGLAMSPAVTGALPFLAGIWGGHQSARTIHFFTTLSLVAFVAGHIAMVAISGFRRHMRAMTIGGEQ